MPTELWLTVKWLERSSGIVSWLQIMAFSKVLQERGQFRRESAGFQTEVEVENPKKKKKRTLECWKNKVPLDSNRKNYGYNFWHMRRSRNKHT